jgi:hypothetical protein
LNVKKNKLLFNHEKPTSSNQFSKLKFPIKFMIVDCKELIRIYILNSRFIAFLEFNVARGWDPVMEK